MLQELAYTYSENNLKIYLAFYIEISFSVSNILMCVSWVYYFFQIKLESKKKKNNS